MTDKPLGASMDNVLAWRLGEACNKAAAETAGDYIDRGLALRRRLEDAGFGIVQLDPASTLFGGRRAPA